MKKLLAKILTILAIIAIIAMIVLLVVISGGAVIQPIVVFGVSMAAATFAYGIIAISIGVIILAYMLDSEATKKVLAKVGKGAKAIGKAVGSAVGGFFKNAISDSGLLSLLLPIGLGYIIFKGISRDKATTTTVRYYPKDKQVDSANRIEEGKKHEKY